MVTQHPLTMVEELMAQFTVVELPPDAPEVERLVGQYRARFGLEARDPKTERALVWRGVRYQDRIVAVFGERLDGKTLEVTDAYRDEGPIGTAAFMMVGHGYLRLVQKGTIDQLVHTILFANREHWEAVMRVTGDSPYALTFVHRKKEAA